MAQLYRRTIFVFDREEHGSSIDFLWVEGWLERWKNKVRIANYSSGGWEHLWDVEGPEEAMIEIPADYLCDGDWPNSNC
jgi:hypothetical protein